jgi:nicotinamidase-related amidase
MALTTLDPKTALIVVDLQKGIVGMPGPVLPIDDVIRRSASLAAAFREHGLPVVLVNATGRAPGRTEGGRSRGNGAAPSPDWADIVDELDPQPTDIRITKQRWGAFHGTALDERLREHGVTQVVLTGVSTSAGVESTARFAHEHGYHVTLATDAMTDTDPATHENSVQRIFPKLGETGTTAEILRLLAKNR